MTTVVSSPWSGARISTRNQLVSKVCALYGYSTSDRKLVNKVLTWLDDSVKDLNTRIWQSTLSVETGILMVASQQYVTVDSLFYKESQAYLTDNSTGDQGSLKYLPWVHFKRLYPGTDTSNDGGGDTGRPTIYTIFNFEKDAKIYLYPIPSSDTVSQYTLTLEYYKRLPKISSVSINAAPDIPEEFENAILFGAYKRFAMDVGETEKVNLYAAMEKENILRIKEIDSAHPDADRRFRLINDQHSIYNHAGYVYPF